MQTMSVNIIWWYCHFMPLGAHVRQYFPTCVQELMFHKSGQRCNTGNKAVHIFAYYHLLSNLNFFCSSSGLRLNIRFFFFFRQKFIFILIKTWFKRGLSEKRTRKKNSIHNPLQYKVQYRV